eukprot:gene28052-36966_t
MSERIQGKFKIPTFQRDFVWGTKEKIELFDSISKDYPIGSILLWKPNEEFKEKAEIGPYKIDSNAKEGLRSEISDKSLSEKLISKAKHISSTIIDYSIPLVEIDGGSIEEAVNIFSRINSKGVTISPDWMLSALTSSEKDGFNL